LGFQVDQPESVRMSWRIQLLQTSLRRIGRAQDQRDRDQVLQVEPRPKLRQVHHHRRQEQEANFRVSLLCLRVPNQHRREVDEDLPHVEDGRWQRGQGLLLPGPEQVQFRKH